MMHYRKGKNVEEEIKKDDLPFDDFITPEQNNFLWMQVKGGTKVANVISYVRNAIDKQEYRTVVWSGSGGGLVRTVSCAEILKRSYPLYQVTRMCYTDIKEHWTPLTEGLEEIVVNRQIPSLHILMSLNPIDDNVSGLQKPNSVTDFWQHEPSHSSSKRVRQKPQDRQPRTQKSRGKTTLKGDKQQRQSKAPQNTGEVDTKPKAIEISKKE